MELSNPYTKKWINAYINRPSTTLIVNTPNDTNTGVEIAEYIYSELVRNKNNPLYRLELKDGKSIGIEDIRDFQSTMSLKAISDADYTRFSIIPNAEKLTPEAQNALLKLTEELPAKTILILVMSNTDNILPTLKSRCFQIHVLPITKEQAIEYGNKSEIDNDLVTKAYVISEGNKSIFLKLLSDKDKYYENTINQAKKFITFSVFERQLLLLDMFKSKELVVNDFIQAIKLTARTGMRSASNIKSKNSWKTILAETIITETQIEHKVQTKLALLALSIRI